MSLFESDGYEVRKRRKPRTVHREMAIHVEAPWVLLRHHAQPPQAHLVMGNEADPMVRRLLDRDRTPQAIPRCKPKKAFALLDTTGHPLAPVCPHCLAYARKNKIKVEVIERG